MRNSEILESEKYRILHILLEKEEKNGTTTFLALEETDQENNKRLKSYRRKDTLEDYRKDGPKAGEQPQVNLREHVKKTGTYLCKR